jgi:intracellular sulfur oxidation DsrE/DsrF family protein
MPRLIYLASCLLFLMMPAAHADFVQTPYTAQKIVYEFYFDEPDDINSALFWLRSHVNPLSESPYDIGIDENDIKVVIHGTEIVTVAKKNYNKYREAVERMRYYADLGVEFKVCALAAKDFDYAPDDFHDFIDVVPSAMTELAHWQLQGYALMRPVILHKKYRNEEIR